MTTTAAEAWAQETEQRVLDAAVRLAPELGWTQAMVVRAGVDAGMSAAETELLLPHGPADLAALLSRRHDARALAALANVHPDNLKIREKVRRAVEARIDAAAADEAALRRCLGFLALPARLRLAGRLAWESADVLWRWAGDTATDENHYTKRMILSGILTGAIAIRLSSGRGAAMAFVDRRIEDVMRFEKWNATTNLRPGQWLELAAVHLGRVRHGR
jgi:ubiquinone biosynthesis protein COQ9